MLFGMKNDPVGLVSKRHRFSFIFRKEALMSGLNNRFTYLQFRYVSQWLVDFCVKGISNAFKIF